MRLSVWDFDSKETSEEEEKQSKVKVEDETEEMKA